MQRQKPATGHHDGQKGKRQALTALRAAPPVRGCGFWWGGPGMILVCVRRSHHAFLSNQGRGLLPQTPDPADDRPPLEEPDRRSNPADHLGTSTALTTWITPFDCMTSEIVTRAALPFSS